MTAAKTPPKPRTARTQRAEQGVQDVRVVAIELPDVPTDGHNGSAGDRGGGPPSPPPRRPGPDPEFPWEQAYWGMLALAAFLLMAVAGVRFGQEIERLLSKD